MKPSSYSKWFERFRKETGFPDLKLHELRHTQASQLLANGVDVKTVQERLGHARASITLDIYAHTLPDNDRKAADLVGVLFSGKEKKAKVIKFKAS